MEDEKNDQPVLSHIQRLAEEEHLLYGHSTLSKQDNERLDKIRVELDQCWDLLRQRRALRDAGQDPSHAHVRPADVVEGYEG